MLISLINYFAQGLIEKLIYIFLSCFFSVISPQMAGQVAANNFPASVFAFRI